MCPCRGSIVGGTHVKEGEFYAGVPAKFGISNRHPVGLIERSVEISTVSHRTMSSILLV